MVEVISGRPRAGMVLLDSMECALCRHLGVRLAIGLARIGSHSWELDATTGSELHDHLLVQCNVVVFTVLDGSKST